MRKRRKSENRIIARLKKNYQHIDGKTLRIMMTVQALLSLLMAEVDFANRRWWEGALSGVFSIVLLLLCLHYQFKRNKEVMTIGSGICLLLMTTFFICAGGTKLDFVYLLPPVAAYCYGLYFGGIGNLLVLVLYMAYRHFPYFALESRLDKIHTGYFSWILSVDILVSFVLAYNIHRYREEHEQLLQKAEKANQAKSDFLANMSHEIRTPMNSILGLCELTMAEELPDNARENCNNISVAGRNLLGIINDLLDFSKLESGHMKLRPDNYLLSNLLIDVIRMTMARKGKKSIEFMVDCDPTIPNFLFGDEMRIRQVVINLLTNAVKFTQKGGVLLRVRGRRESYGINLMITVTDSGIGIARENMDEIFNSFSQVDTKKNRGIEGTGIGLSLSKQLTKQMGGFLYVDSEYDKGSSFTVVIPQKVTEEKPLAKLEGNNSYNILTYFELEEHNSPFVAQCYADIIANMGRGLGIAYTMATSLQEVSVCIAEGGYTHLFLSEPVYEDNREYFDSIVNRIELILIRNQRKTEESFEEIRSICKPFYVLPVCDVLQGERLRFDGTRAHIRRRFLAPQASILVVDDNQMNLKVAEGLLRPYRLEVVTADSGPAAVELLGQRSFDLVLMDHMMPGMDGVEAMRKIRSMDYGVCKTVPILALTANTVSGAKEMFLNEGFCDMVAKPVEMRLFEGALLRWLPKEKILHEEETDE